MAPSSIDTDQPTAQQDNWGPQDDQEMGPGGGVEPANGASLPADDDRATGQGTDSAEYPGGSTVNAVNSSDNNGEAFREKQVKVLRSLLVSSVPLL